MAWASYSSFLLLFFSVTVFALGLTDGALVPAMFIFGDSTADVGTNNFLPKSLAKANFPHYGIDFPGHKPTGRFSNGFNSADLLAQLLGFQQSPPPYLYLLTKNSSYFNKHIARGVNFASAGAGILDKTGAILGEVVPMRKQLQQFATVVGNLRNQVGLVATESLLAKSMIVISVGSNDILEFFDFANTHPTPSQTKEFFAIIKKEYDGYIRTLFNLGARKFGVVSAPLLGCCPYQRIQNKTGGCMEGLNRYTRMFYSTISPLLASLSSELKGMKYSLGNADEMMSDFLRNPRNLGFKDVKNACCGDELSPCEPNSKLCLNREEYLFWDMYHPTEAASKLAAFTLVYGYPRFVAPINFHKLAEDDS